MFNIGSPHEVVKRRMISRVQSVHGDVDMCMLLLHILALCLIIRAMKQSELIRWLDAYLDVGAFSHADSAMNGIQIAGPDKTVNKIAFSVDACEASLRRAHDLGAGMLFVHHGLFWGRPLAVTGIHHARLAYAIEHDLSLYAAHLPLDAHPRVGNNASMADALGLIERKPFGRYHGIDIGVCGLLPEAMSLTDIADTLGFSSQMNLLRFGSSDQVRSVAIVSGGAAMNVEEAIEKKFDLYITGEVLHQVYHLCLENEIHLMAGGHYATEVFGPVALSKLIHKELGVETVFIDIPTGL